MTTPTREQIGQWADAADDFADNKLQQPGEYHPDWHTVRDEHFATLARADLEATIAEQAAEIERLKEEGSIYKNNNTIRQENHSLRQQLTQAQVELESLQKVIEHVILWDKARRFIMPYHVRDPLIAAIATPKEKS